jgi:hypothetical protein
MPPTHTIAYPHQHSVKKNVHTTNIYLLIHIFDSSPVVSIITFLFLPHPQNGSPTDGVRL